MDHRLLSVSSVNLTGDAMEHDATNSRVSGPQLQVALDRIQQILLAGLGHGFFRCEITGQIGKGGRRELLIDAGHRHKFVIPEGELPH